MPRFQYPFANVAHHDEHVRVVRGFSIQKAIDSTKGTIFEVGGPSDEGFFFLKGCSFPRRPIITNKLKHGGMKEKEDRQLYMKYIEETLDIRKVRLGPQSVGICLASCLSVIADEPSEKKHDQWEKAWQALAQEDKELLANPIAVPKIGLRHILLHRAYDFMEEGGLLILEGVREAELKYALTRKFTLKAATLPKKSNKETVYQSLILQR